MLTRNSWRSLVMFLSCAAFMARTASAFASSVSRMRERRTCFSARMAASCLCGGAGEEVALELE